MKRTWNKRILHLSQSDEVISVSYFHVICFRFLSEQTMPCSLTLTFEGLTSIFTKTVTGQIAFMWTTSSKTCSDSKLRSFLLFLLLEKETTQYLFLMCAETIQIDAFLSFVVSSVARLVSLWHATVAIDAYSNWCFSHPSLRQSLPLSSRACRLQDLQ